MLQNYDDRFGLVCVHTFSVVQMILLPLPAALPVQSLRSEQPGGQMKQQTRSLRPGAAS